ncbi:MAG: FAD:protein FMN transferase [Woeseiaceae bacterium]|nr:FAD:protein FMN transferase [Woeseiaceae bacterium]
MMGTEVSVYLWHGEGQSGPDAAAAVFAEIERIEDLMSTYREESRISEINREAAVRPVVAGRELHDLIVRALDISVLTRGAFDITYDSVRAALRFPRRRAPG